MDNDEHKDHHYMRSYILVQSRVGTHQLHRSHIEDFHQNKFPEIIVLEKHLH